MGIFGKPKPPPPPPNNPGGGIIAAAGILIGLIATVPSIKKWIDEKWENSNMTDEERRLREEQARLQREKEAEERCIAREAEERRLAREAEERRIAREAEAEERRIAREKREKELALQLEEERRRQQEERERKRAEILNTAWWNIPEGKILLIDTCVWMRENTPEFVNWFEWLSENAPNKNWSVMVEHSVFQEIEKNRKQKGLLGLKARMAHSRVRKMQQALLPHKLFIWQNASVPNKTEDKIAYADPDLVQRMKTDDNIILVTCDFSLAMTAKQITGSVERILDLDNFVALIK